MDFGGTAEFDLTNSITSKTSAGVQYFRNIISGTGDGTVVLAFDLVEGAAGSGTTIVTLGQAGGAGLDRLELMAKNGGTAERIGYQYGDGAALRSGFYDKQPWPPAPMTHLALIYGSSGGEFFVDGVSRDTNVNASNLGFTNNRIYVGDTWSGTSGTPHFGHVRDVEIYDRRLTSGEIANLSNRQNDPVSGLLASRFDGTNDYGSITSSMTGATDSKVGTLSCWIRLDGGDSTDLDILFGKTSSSLR